MSYMSNVAALILLAAHQSYCADPSPRDLLTALQSPYVGASRSGCHRWARSCGAWLHRLYSPASSQRRMIVSTHDSTSSADPMT
jgi:hypothetical protein